MPDGWLDIAQKVTSSVAFIAGSAWVLMNYYRNRTHSARLQIEVEATYFEKDERHFVLAKCRVKNVGQSIVRLPKPDGEGAGPRGSALIVRALPKYPSPEEPLEALWDTNGAAYDVFRNHQSIEPGLSIVEEKLICQPVAANDAVWVQLRVSAHKQKWTAIAVSTFDTASMSTEKGDANA